MKTNFNFYSRLFDKLFPIPRSIMGDGYRDSLKIISKYIPFKIYKFNSGKKIFDWKVPYEWKIWKKADWSEKHLIIIYEKFKDKIIKFCVKNNLIKIKPKLLENI